MRRLVLLVLMSTGLLFQLDAQKGQISGSIQDSSSGEVIPFATVALYQDGEAAPYSGAVSDEKGEFELKNLDFGQYRLYISFIGFETDSSRLIDLSRESPEFKLGAVALSAISVKLEEAEVKAIAATVNSKIDRRV